MKMPTGAISRFHNDVEGASTAWSIFWTLIFLIMSGFVIDTANAYKYRQVLTATAESASLAALMNYNELQYYGLYDQKDEEYYVDGGATPPTGYTRARTVAKDLATKMMNTANNGNVITDADVELGNWNGTTFTAWDGTGTPAYSINAARATAYRSSRRADPNDANPLDTLLLGAFGGLEFWDVAGQSVAAMFVPCPYAYGLIATGKVDMSSNNTFSGQLCIHGQGEENKGNKNPAVGIDLQQNNSFDDTVHVSSNGEFETQVAGSGADDADSNLENRYNPASLQPTGVTEFPNIQAMLETPEDVDLQKIKDYMPDYIIETAEISSVPIGDNLMDTPLTAADIAELEAGHNPNNYTVDWPIVSEVETSPGVTEPLTATRFENLLADIAAGTISSSDFAGKIYHIDCSGGGADKTVDFNQEITLTNIAVVSNECRYSLSSNITIASSILLTDHNGPNASIQGSNGVTIGSGACEDSAGSKIMARGTIDFASDMTMISSLIVSEEEDVYYAAKADGMDGSSVHAGGNIYLRSQAEFQDCPGAVPTKNFTTQSWYRLVN
ncbi:TadE/TadG family type IV pilus assembly protein [Halovulum sp. GXIMD14794]